MGNVSSGNFRIVIECLDLILVCQIVHCNLSEINAVKRELVNKTRLNSLKHHGVLFMDIGKQNSPRCENTASHLGLSCLLRGFS